MISTINSHQSPNVMYRKILFFLFIYCSTTSACSINLSGSGYKYLSRYNIIWDSPSENPSGSMPIGGGDMGGNVWVEGGKLYLYLQRSGCFCDNGEYLKLGRYCINLSPNPFENYQDFKQELHLIDGYISIKAKNNQVNTEIKVWIDIPSHTIHIAAESDKRTDIKVSYESWRTFDREMLDTNRGRFSVFSLEHYPGKVWKAKDTICYKDNSILFYHRNSANPLAHAVTIEQQGVGAYKEQITDHNSNLTFGGKVFGENLIPDTNEEGVFHGTPFKSWSLRSKYPTKKYHVIIATYKEQTATVEEWEKNLKASIRSIDQKTGNFRKNIAWWNEFWNRSWIITDPLKKESDSRVWQMGRNYQLMRFELGGNLYGDYPTKFNGGNLTFDPVFVKGDMKHDPDYRYWGGNTFTAQNQRLLYWPMLKSGDTDGMKSEFNLYEWGLPGAKAKVRTAFGHNGAVYSEYASSAGLDIASGWGWKEGKNRLRGTEISFGDPRADATKKYNSIVENGVMANGLISYHWGSQVERVYMMLEYHRFSGKSIDKYMPFIKSSLIFFDEHYQKRQQMRNGKSLDENGKLIFFPSTACESYRGTKNPVDIVSGIRSCLEALVTIESDSISIADKHYFKGYLERLPGLHYGTLENGSRIIEPGESYVSYENEEAPQFYPLFPFDWFDIKSDKLPIFRNTYKTGQFVKGHVESWHQDGIQLARMGMIDEAFEYNMQKLKDAPRRFPAFWGPNSHDWDPDHNWGASGMIGLQEMLMQTIGDKIYLLPTWPKGKDVYFKLHAPYNTTVELEYIGGKVEKIEVYPKERRKNVEVLII